MNNTNPIMKFNKESGQISRTLIILAFAVLLMGGAIYGVLRFGAGKKARLAQEEAEKSANTEPPKPVYETQLGDIRFLFDSAYDLGSVVKAVKQNQQDIKTTEKFIYLTVRAQNKGKGDTVRYSWDIGNIVDSEGRNFLPYENSYGFLPQPDLCGAILKPEFEPTPCVKMYEVSKISDNLKIEIKFVPQNSSKPQSALLDLKVK